MRRRLLTAPSGFPAGQALLETAAQTVGHLGVGLGAATTGDPQTLQQVVPAQRPPSTADMLVRDPSGVA